jgi:hypothetical protein
MCCFQTNASCIHLKRLRESIDGLMQAKLGRQGELMVTR